MLGVLEGKDYFCSKYFSMKKIIICLLISVLGYTAHAQRFNVYQDDWKVSVGVNAVGSTGTRNPVGKLDQYGFQFPLMVALEYQWDDQFAVELDLSLNGFKEGSYFDGKRVSEESITYFSVNPNIKWYFTDYLFDLYDLDLYLSAGAGIFYLSELNTSANLSIGGMYWFEDNMAIRLQSTGKFAANAKGHYYANNHFQHSLMIVFRF